jgi:hypothetical protein
VVKVSVSQPRDHGFEHFSGYDNVSSCDTSTGWFQELDSKVINLSCKTLFRNRAKINMFKPICFMYICMHMKETEINK